MFPSVFPLRGFVRVHPAVAPALLVACLAPVSQAKPAPEVHPVVIRASLGVCPLTPSERLAGLSPQRITHFRKTMADLSGSALPAPSLHFRAEYVAAAPRLGSEKPASLFAEDDTLVMSPGMVGRDLMAEEEFLLAGREDDFHDASRKWLSRTIKGSDAAAHRRAGRFAPKFAWDDGPLTGFRRGPISVMAGEDQWSFRWSRKMVRPGWVARVSCGVEDGEEQVAFSIGRSLFHARTARR